MAGLKLFGGGCLPVKIEQVTGETLHVDAGIVATRFFCACINAFKKRTAATLVRYAVGYKYTYE